MNYTTAPSAGQTQEEPIVKCIKVKGKVTKLHTDDYGSTTFFQHATNKIDSDTSHLYIIQQYSINFSVSTQKVTSLLLTTSNQNVTIFIFRRVASKLTTPEK